MRQRGAGGAPGGEVDARPTGLVTALGRPPSLTPGRRLRLSVPGPGGGLLKMLPPNCWNPEASGQPDRATQPGVRGGPDQSQSHNGFL